MLPARFLPENEPAGVSGRLFFLIMQPIPQIGCITKNNFHSDAPFAIRASDPYRNTSRLVYIEIIYFFGYTGRLISRAVPVDLITYGAFLKKQCE